MRFTDRPCRYFMKYGSQNTNAVLEAVYRRAGEGDLKTVVVASTSGRTGAKFAEALKGKADVIVVSYEEMSRNFKRRIAELGGVVVEKAHLPLHKRGMDKVRNAFYTLGQGFKVAVEAVLIAADKKLIKTRAVVIGVGGTRRGADTAIVVKAVSTKDMLGPDLDKRLEIREIIAMPLKKKWWE